MDQTSLQTLKSRCNKLQSNKGFTLIEVLIVLVLIAGVTAYTVPRLSTGDKIRGVIRKMTVIMKQTQTEARLRSTVYRMVIQMSEDPESTHTYWVEKASQKNVKIDYSEENPNKDRLDSEETKPSQFQIDSRLSKNKIPLPETFFFEDVEFSNTTVKEGKAFIYFFPQGLVTKALVHITNRDKINYTIIINPLTGQTTILNERKSFKDIE